MNREDLGSYFINNGELYYCEAYIESPALELKNIRTGQKSVVVIGSVFSTEFSKLFSTPAHAWGYDLGQAVPVEDININKEVK